MADDNKILTPEEEEEKRRKQAEQQQKAAAGQQPYSQQISDLSNTQAANTRQRYEDMATLQDQQGQANVAALETAQKQFNDDYNEAQRIYKERRDAGYTNIYDIIAGERERMRQADEEARAQIEGAQKASIWTGVTEAAAGLANLIGVGQLNAVSQQYRPVSQDWMARAERDMREHRNRMDNLNDRLNSIRLQQEQLRMNDADKALALAREAADRNYNNTIALQQARNDAALRGAETRMTGAERADAAELAGLQNAASIYNQEEGRRLQQQSLGLQRESLQLQRERYSSSTRSGTDKTDEFPVIDADGNVHTVSMTSEQRQNMFTNAPAAIRRDLGEKQADEFEKQLRKAVGSKDEKRVNEVYAEWIGKSPTMRKLLLEYDPEYKGKHGTKEEPQPAAAVTPSAPPDSTGTGRLTPEEAAKRYWNK